MAAKFAPLIGVFWYATPQVNRGDPPESGWIHLKVVLFSVGLVLRKILAGEFL